jgi:hypothetical protein
LTVVAEAKPVIVLVVASTCFRSKNAEEFALIDVDESNTTPSRLMVNVCVEAEVLATTILLITVVVEAGTVYRVVLVNAAAVLASALVAVAIIYYLSC